MKSIHKKYLETLNKMITIAEIIDIPYYHLVQHKREIQRKLKQASCNHHKLVMSLKNENIRVWTCAECGKIIDYETIK